MFAAIIVAAGSGTRAGFDKLSADLAGKSVLRRSIDAFLAVPEIEQIVVVSPKERFEAVCTESDEKISRVDGGSERYFSVINGLRALKSEVTWVAVHDGARPLISPKQIKACFAAAKKYGASSCAHPIVDTLKRCDEDGKIADSVSREHLWAMETPQVMRKIDLEKAYQFVLENGLSVTDEVSALQFIGLPVFVVSNNQSNMKITLPGDLEIAKRLLEE